MGAMTNSYIWKYSFDLTRLYFTKSDITDALSLNSYSIIKPGVKLTFSCNVSSIPEIDCSLFNWESVLLTFPYSMKDSICFFMFNWIGSSLNKTLSYFSTFIESCGWVPVPPCLLNTILTFPVVSEDGSLVYMRANLFPFPNLVDLGISSTDVLTLIPQMSQEHVLAAMFSVSSFAAMYSVLGKSFVSIVPLLPVVKLEVGQELLLQQFWSYGKDAPEDTVHMFAFINAYIQALGNSLEDPTLFEKLTAFLHKKVSSTERYYHDFVYGALEDSYRNRIDHVVARITGEDSIPYEFFRCFSSLIDQIDFMNIGRSKEEALLYKIRILEELKARIIAQALGLGIDLTQPSYMRFH